MNASDLLRNALLQLSKSGTVRTTIERAPVSRGVVRRFVPGEATADRPRQRTQQRRLADPDVAFEQHVAASEDRDDGEDDRRLLADHDVCDPGVQRLRQVARTTQVSVVIAAAVASN